MGNCVIDSFPHLTRIIGMDAAFFYKIRYYANTTNECGCTYIVLYSYFLQIFIILFVRVCKFLTYLYCIYKKQSAAEKYTDHRNLCKFNYFPVFVRTP